MFTHQEGKGSSVRPHQFAPNAGDSPAMTVVSDKLVLYIEGMYLPTVLRPDAPKSILTTYYFLLHNIMRSASCRTCAHVRTQHLTSNKCHHPIRRRAEGRERSSPRSSHFWRRRSYRARDARLASLERRPRRDMMLTMPTPPARNRGGGGRRPRLRRPGRPPRRSIRLPRPTYTSLANATAVRITPRGYCAMRSILPITSIRRVRTSTSRPIFPYCVTSTCSDIPHCRAWKWTKSDAGPTCYGYWPCDGRAIGPRR